jgi:MFS family permease
MSSILLLALGAMLAQQTLVTLGKTIVPVIGPAMTKALGVEPELVGVFVSVTGIASTFGAAAAGRWIQHFGAMRVSQLSLLMVAGGLALALPGWIPVIAFGACVLGFGTVLATPASSEILARYAPPRHAALIFSLKQTGVPGGTMLAGIIGPLCVVALDWRAALIVVVGITVLLAGVLEPLTRRFDSDQKAAKGGPRRGMLDTLRLIFADRNLRGLAFAHGAYVGLQHTFTTFFVTFAVVKLNYDLVVAGQVFAASQVVAMFARVFWGWLGTRLDGMALLGLLGLAMALIAVVMGLVTPDWPFAAVVAVALALAGTAVSWHGINLSEIARLAPTGMVGAVTGGIIAFGSVSGILFPVGMTALLATTGSYALCFWIAAVAPLLVGVLLLRRPAPQIPQSGPA